LYGAVTCEGYARNYFYNGNYIFLEERKISFPNMLILASLLHLLTYYYG
jgi:hypothetical protein